MRKVAFFFLLTLLPGWIFSQTSPSCAADLYREMYARQYPELAERARKLELQLDSSNTS